MSAYDEGRRIEQIAVEEILPWLLDVCDGQVYATDASEFLQKVWGDFIATIKDKRYPIELKSEWNHTGNLFFELWSNKHWWTPGWMYTCHAAYLFYFFVENKTLYSFDFVKLKQWLFGHGDKRGALYGPKYHFPEQVQKRRSQPNDTWGALIGLDVLEKEVGFKKLTEADLKLRMANPKRLIVVDGQSAAASAPRK